MERLPFPETIIINHRVADEHEHDCDYDFCADDGYRDAVEYRDVEELIALWLISEGGCLNPECESECHREVCLSGSRYRHLFLY